MASSEQFMAEFRSLKFKPCIIQANIYTWGLKFAEFEGLKLKAWRILANFGTRRLKLDKFLANH